MNERIKELALLSGFDIDTNVSFAEKTRLNCFAELIVKECVKVTLESIYHNGIGDVNDCIIVGNDVAEHFGVEE
jgi:hypothetical protein